MKIKKEQIIALHDCGIESVQILLQQFFPKVFEPKLEVGKWYKGHVDFNSVIYVTEIQKIKNESRNHIHYYGFLNDKYYEKDYIANKDHEQSLAEATESEVFEALEKQAKLTGYKNGNYKCLSLPEYTHEVNEVYHFDIYENKLFLGNGRGLKANVVFCNGKWSTIIKKKKMTQSQIEAELGYKIEII
jgi:hypothetical protein